MLLFTLDAKKYFVVMNGCSNCLDEDKIIHMSRCVLEPPVLPADLFVPTPGYEAPPDLATILRPLVYTFSSLRCPQHRFECLE